ncbi:MAG: right-handed parallel beta-helix repeat-containing protein [Actinophytocola sp.]|uniref:right-handed parallel beta-helix repeat-containing protein n=1 Tax=Actinophytocola sp. TaxID=1872138 RepID=UPI003C71CFBD
MANDRRIPAVLSGRARTLTGAVVVAAWMTVSGTATTAVAAPNIHCGDTIFADLVANADLTCLGDGLAIGADDVTLDLGGHTIAGSGTGTGLAVTGRSGVTVRNGTIADFSTGSPPLGQAGVVADNAPNFTFHHVTTHNTSVAILSSDDAVVTGATVGGAFDTNFSERVSLTGNRFAGTWTRLANGSQHTITGNAFDDSDLVFIESASSQTRDNIFVDARVVVGVVAMAHTIAHNVFTGAGSGVSMADASSSATVTGNIFQGSLIGVRPKLPYAFAATVIGHNTFLDAGAAGVLLDGGGGGTGPLDIRGNTVIGSGHQSGGMTDGAGNTVNDGIHINAPSGSNITITGNHTANSEDFGIEATPGTVIDGGGNTSTGDPNGCLGVTCA